jgi:hypothetical protein
VQYFGGCEGREVRPGREPSLVRYGYCIWLFRMELGEQQSIRHREVSRCTTFSQRRSRYQLWRNFAGS